MKRPGVKWFAVIVPVFMAVFTACGDQALFDELATNRLKVVIKGTYESNNSRPLDTGVILDDVEVDDSLNSVVYETDGVTPYEMDFPTRFMIDFAELRLGGKKFANYRETYNAGMDDLEPFFTDGIGYSNDDVPNGTYSHVGMYIRKMIFNNAAQFERISGVWTYSQNVETIFAEKAVEGFDFNQLQVNSYYDSLRLESGRVNRIFPLSIPIDGGLIYDKEDKETVLEIRLVVKNFIKVYEYDYTGGLVHYFGLSDWLRDVQADEKDIGGNVIAVARAYVPGKTATINDSGAGANSYVVAIYAENDIADYTLAPGAGDRSTTLSPPKAPILADSTDIEAYLDYFLQYEVYKEDYNAFAVIVNDETTYESDYAVPWEDYNDGLKSFRIPPLVTYTTTGTFTFTNVPVGRTYRVYYWNGAVNPGELPGRGANFVELTGVPLVIDETDAGTIVNIP
ncbi:MAG TPA: hypothetical protein VLM75_13205 [Spirochaetota bacterium]|nr:hypothetical protein [Spirochaetota bacterium]